MSDRFLYRGAAEDLRANDAQWRAYESTGHCVLLAGPGSGKTKTLATKLARMLDEDVEAPRGLACITYNNECAREIEQRLDALGVSRSGRVFVGTVHSFSLTQIVLPYARSAGLGLPDDFEVATEQQQRQAFERAYNRVAPGPQTPASWRFRANRYRRTYVNRGRPEWRETDATLAALVETYEAELRALGTVDFDDMPLLALRALAENGWLRTALVAKYPILAVDEYQDLGTALHSMVLGLCFRAGMRLFAVGDVDQSIYGFIGAAPDLLRRLSERDDVETIRLGINYRCGSRIVTASEYALGEARGYRASDGAPEGTIYFHPKAGTSADRARFLVGELLPAIQGRHAGLRLGEVAVLYATASMGDEVADAAAAAGIATVRTDGNALYPRGSRLMRWLEQCAVWCCGGWRTGRPRMANLVEEGCRLFRDVVADEDGRVVFRRLLVENLWAHRDAAASLHDWLADMDAEIVRPMVERVRTLAEERETLVAFIARLHDGDPGAMALGDFSGIGIGADRLNLSTLHSAKGREFDVVVLFEMDEGKLPRNNPLQDELREARRLFYVGITRARKEVHLIYGMQSPSRFVADLEQRLAGSG
ncbi:ATP-dependent helicase [Aureimonas leprariae]|uniref:DNA 3'-5' helicase n=1 Tax=Plantimonas leprariae TaxID=2615207 RepID=A0A7V7PSC9_9HYPH|nr:ATP-dependent helicase [Aureimonas leprariae]KAB0682048.1 ATP-dependent helicase [Aureimonas leprariae]